MTFKSWRELEEGKYINQINFFTLPIRSYGAVYKAFHKKSNKLVALKKQKIDGDLEDVLIEVNIMAKIESPYLVKFLGSKLAVRKEDGLDVEDMWVTFFQ